MSLQEIHNKRFIEVLTKGYDKIWTVESLLNRINFLLPSNIEMSERQLIFLINKQSYFYVFKCSLHHSKESKTYYIFKRYLPR